MVNIMSFTHARWKAALLATTVGLIAPAALAQQDDTQGGSAVPDAEEIVVKGRFIPDEKRATSEISNILDVEDLKLTGDSDIAGALQRVTGLSLVSGRFVFVRGLGERYSSALLDGSPLPSPEPLNRVIPLDIFPSSLLSGALVQKTYSPQYPLEFGGGVIELRTKAVPDERFFSIGVSGEFNTASSFKDGLSHDGPNSEVLGFRGNRRALPDLFKNNPTLAGLTPAELETAGEAFPNIWSIDSEPNPANVGIEFSYGDRFDVGDGQLGILIAIDYSSEFQNRNGERRTFSASNQGLFAEDQIAPDGCQEIDGIDPADCGFRSTEWEVGLNGIATVGYEFNVDHAIKYTGLILRKSSKESIIEQGSFADDPGRVRVNSRIDYIEQHLWTNQVSGEHVFDLFADSASFSPMELTWRVGYSDAYRDQPLRRDTAYFFNETSEIFELSARTDGNRTSFSFLDDEVISGGVDVKQPVNLFGTDIDIRAGFAYEDKERTSITLNYGFELPPGTNRDLLAFIPEIIFGPDNVGPGGVFLREFVDPSDEFRATFENIQAYGGIDAAITDRLRLALGMRYENSEQFVDTFDRLTSPISPVQVTLDREDFLPSGTLTWEFYENMQVRAGFSQTVSRPDLRELSSATFLDPERDRPVRGNPFLQITKIDNYDIRWEWYIGRDESITVGAFYKEFSRPIERVFTLEGNTRLRSFENALSAELIGIEAEVQIGVPLGEWLEWSALDKRDFFVRGNGAWIDSEITLDPTVASNATNAVRPLQGQSKWLGNLQFGYERTDLGERAVLALNYTGNRINDVGLFGAPDVIETPPILIDFIFAREVEMFGGLFEFSFKARNLLNENFVLKQGGQIFERYKLGRDFSFGAKVTF